jgi:hypothetical protein
VEVLSIEEEAICRVQLQYLKVNKKIWFTNHCTTVVWAFFVLKNLLEKVLLGVPQTMRHALFAMSLNKFKVQTMPFINARAFSPTIQCMASPP